MRIAHVTDCYLPRLGGIEMQVRDLALRQRMAGHDVTVFTATDADTTRTVGHSRSAGATDSSGASRPGLDDVPTVRLPSRGGWVTPGGLRRLGPRLLAGDFDVVHGHTSLVSPLAWRASRVSSSAGIPTVMTMHSLCKVPTGLLRMHAPIWGWTDLPVQWTAVSAVAAEAVNRMLPGHDVLTLPNGIDASVWKVPERPTNPRRLQVVSVMRLMPRKRPMHLLRILREIRRQLPADVELCAVIIGTGPEQAAMDRYLDRHRMRGWVELAGRCDRQTIRDIHAASDVYLAPATLESYGIAALEARCAALPVVAMRVGGVGEFVRHGREGLLVSSDAEMATATADLLRSPERLQRMREHNRTTEPTTSWSRVLELAGLAYRRAGLPDSLLTSEPDALPAASIDSVDVRRPERVAPPR